MTQYKSLPDLRSLAFEHYTDLELLATLLQDGTRVQALSAAAKLLKEFGSLRGLLSADPRSVGPTRHAKIQVAVEFANRILEETLRREDAIRSVQDTRRLLGLRLRDRHNEVFAVLFLDNRHRLIAYEEMFFGTIDGASVHPCQVVRRALFHNAAAVVLAHNHPSGVAEPSQADEYITHRLKETLHLIDVRVLDHIVVGDGEAVSFAERGLL